MKSRILIGCIVMLNLLMAPPLLAQDEEESPWVDARLVGYQEKVQLDRESAATSWIILVGLGVLGLGVMFKDAKRTHLD